MTDLIPRYHTLYGKGRCFRGIFALTYVYITPEDRIYATMDTCDEILDETCFRAGSIKDRWKYI